MNSEFLNDVIEERITYNLNKLHEDIEWKNKNEEYRKFYDVLFNSLNPSACEQLEKMMYFKLELLSAEVYVAYKTGFVDGIKLNEQFGNSRN